MNPLHLLSLVFLFVAVRPDDVGQTQIAPRLVAHRGLFKHAPENTLAAFRACIDLRLGFELDIRRTKDGHLVCMHDDDVRRTTNGAGKVADLTLAELRKLDAGSWFDALFASERVPTLAEVFGLLKNERARNVLVALDIKVEDDALVGDLLHLAEQHGVTRQLVCIGNAISAPALRRSLRQADRRIGIALLAPMADDLPAALKDETADWIYLRFVPSLEQSVAIHKAGKRIFLSGPLVAGQAPDSWQQALAARVDAMLTDYPLECRGVWRKRK